MRAYRALLAATLVAAGFAAAAAQTSTGLVTGSYAGPAAFPVQISGSNFRYQTSTARDAPQTFYEYGQAPAFVVQNCGQQPTVVLNVTVNRQFIPGASDPRDVVHATVLQSFPNNASSSGSNMYAPVGSVFELAEDTILDLTTGSVLALTMPIYATFDQSLGGSYVSNTSNSNAAAQQVYYLNPAQFFSGNASLPVMRANTSAPANATSSQWLKYVEALYYYAGVVATEAATKGACSNDSSAFYQLATTGNYIRDYVLLNTTAPLNATDNITFSERYVIANLTGLPNYVALAYNNSFLPAGSMAMTLDFSSNASYGEAQCLVACKQAQQQNGSCNVFNYCSSQSGCNSLQFGQCQLGYSSAVDANQFVAPASAGTGYVAGRLTAVLPMGVNSTVSNLTTSTPAMMAPVPAPAMAPAPMTSAGPCPCSLAPGFDATNPNLRQMLLSSGNCPPDVYPGCPSGSFGYGNSGGCGNVGCFNTGTNNIGNYNDGTGNQGEFNSGSKLIGRNQTGTGTFEVASVPGVAAAGR
jgi:hypothetical protein